VFTRARIYNGASYLANHLSANDYYAEGEKVTGHWIGRGAELLGLAADVDAEQFEALRTNRVPGTDERLTPRTKGTRQPTIREAEEAFRLEVGRAGSASEVANFRLVMKPLSNRVAFYDYQCSAQKSVSIMAILGGDERLCEAHKRAVRKGFAELERFASRQKNSIAHRDWEMTGNLCAAAFTHNASRALDPQLHTHFVIANATRASSGRWYALEEYHMYKAVRYAGKVYQNEMAREVKALGYSIREVRDEKGQVTGFEIEGVSDMLCERFAKRRAEIEREIEKFEKKHGREPTTSEIGRITRETRGAKLAEITTPEVLAKQRAQLLPDEWERLQEVRAAAVERIKHGQKVETAGQEREAVEAAIDHLYERRTVAYEHEVLAESLNQKLGAVELGTLRQTVEKDEGQLVHLATRKDNPLLSECCTRYGLQLELWSIEFVNDTQHRYASLNREFAPADTLSSQQREAVRAILSTGDQVFGFRGVSGAGKTTTLKEVHRGLTEAGHRSVYIAPTAGAAKVLQSEGFTNATTVEDFLQNVSRREDLQGAVVICDESSLQSNRQGATLLHLAQQQEMRVLLVGDVRQHVSVEAGDFLRILESHSRLHRCEVTEIRRQEKAPAYKAAIEKMAAGEVRGGLAALDAIGWVHEDGADYLERAADSYIRLTQNGVDLESAIAITPTWAENHRLTEAIRSRLREHNQLASEGIDFTVHDSFQWTEQQKRNAANYSAGQSIVFTRPFGDWKPGDSAEVRSVADGGVTVVANGEESPLPIKIKDCFDVGRVRQVEVAMGDKLLIRANQKRLGLINGQVLTLDRIDPDGSIVTREGLRIPSGFRQWCHGHVVTSHKSQGRTHKHVIVAAERLDAKSTYVGCSRGKLTCTIHTPDKHYLQEHLPEGTRRAALDVLSESVSQSPDGTASRTNTVDIPASKKLGSTAAQQVAETAKPRWSERIRKRILKNIQLFQRHRFITERRRAALEIAAKQTQSQPQRLNAQKERPSVRIRIS
jgi:conjugative relaxase-like TrwC/TraI family protein